MATRALIRGDESTGEMAGATAQPAKMITAIVRRNFTRMFEAGLEAWVQLSMLAFFHHENLPVRARRAF